MRMAAAHLRKILVRAQELETFVRIDMESSAYTQRTLEVHEELSNAGVQECWRGAAGPRCTGRPPTSSARSTRGARVRLCKGAYLEPSSVAYAGQGSGRCQLRAPASSA